MITSDSKTKQYEDLLSYLEQEGSQLQSKNQVIEKPVEKPVKEKKGSTLELLEKCKVEKPKQKKKPKAKIKTEKGETGFDIEKFESLMRSRLVDSHIRMQSYDRPYISVTELFSCIRCAFYKREKYPIDVKKQYRFSYLSLINNIGDAIHDFVQELYDFEETEKTIISEKYKTKGRIDGLRGNFLVEFKSIDEQKFIKEHKETYLKDHYNQGLIYAEILNEEYNYNIDTITIVYFLRNLKKVYTFDLPTNPSVAKSFLENALVLKQCLAVKKVPDPINASISQCKFCLYKSYCLKDETEMELPFNRKDNILDKNNMNNAVFLF